MLYHFSVKSKEDFIGMQSQEQFQPMEPTKDVNSNKEHNGEPTTVQELQAALFPPMVNTMQTSLPGGELGVGPATYFSGYLLKTANQILTDEDAQNVRLARLREPKDLFQLKDQFCPAQPARWPAECQVIENRIEHISYNPPVPEQYYIPNMNEAQPKPLGEEFGTVVYNYLPATALNYFNRSCTGGNKIFMQLGIDLEPDDLRFESRFESGNLAKAIKLTSTFYELYVRHDLYTNRHTQWFYFRISNVKRNVLYRFSIVNLSKGDSLYNCGMRPLMYSTKDAKLHSIGWRRWGDNIAYFSNDNSNQEDDQPTTYTLTFTVEFPHDNDDVFLAHSYPYTYTDLQDYLTSLANHPVKSTYTSLRLLCRSLAGNNIYYITITSPIQGDVKKKAIVLTARVHPGESPSSWIMKGLLDFLTGDTGPARELRDKFIFKLVPMLNPDGVIVGNSRCSLTGRDLNRQYRTVIRETYPSIWYTKLMVRRLMDECGVAMYCDIHAHSRQNNVFIYGCENRKGYDRYLQEQVFPLMLHKNAADKFSFEHCKFRIQRAKEGTGRVVMWMMGICNSYTMEASFAGVDMGPKEYTHFSTNDYEQIGKAFCQTLIDFYDETPNKEKLRCKILKKLLKEGSTADEPTNINISDYSSDEGSTSSDEGAGNSDNHPFLVPPPSPSDKPTKKKPPLPAPTSIKISNLPKSPLIQRKVLPMFQATLGFSIEEDDSSGDSDTPNECVPTKLRRPKSRKVLRKKKSKKSNKIRDYHDFSDTEIFNKKSTKCNVLELVPTEKVRSQSWSRYTGFPIPKVVDVRNTAHTAKNLAEVQAKLVLLRRRLWSGSNPSENIPLSCGFSNSIASSTNINTLNIPEKEKEKEKPNKKGKDENEKQEKKSNKKSKRQNKEDGKRASNQSQTKKKSNGITRQSAVDLPENRHPTIKSKSLQPTDAELRRNRDRYMSASESCVDIEDRERKKGKKKKKRKATTWEKKIKTVSTITSLIRKKN